MGAYGHGPTSRETEILDRDEAGESEAQIAEAMGVTRAYVRTRIRYFNSGLDSDRKARRAAEAASKAHLAAIAATGRGYA